MLYTKTCRVENTRRSLRPAGTSECMIHKTGKSLLHQFGSFKDGARVKSTLTNHCLLNLNFVNEH